MSQITIVSPVGNRAIAVVNPIRQLLEAKNIDNCKIILSYLQRETPVCKQSKDWLLSKFPNAQIEIVSNNDALLYCQENSDKEQLYFNINPGLNFELSKLTLQFPETILLFSSDTEFMYVWGYLQDIEKAEKIKLRNIGLEDYAILSSMKIDITEGVKPTLSSKVKQCLQELKKQQSFTINLPLFQVPASINDKMNNIIAWVKEHKGSLYILIDLTDKTLADYRVVKAVFPRMFYNISLILDNKGKLQERSEVDGIHYIDTTSKEWQQNIKKWIQGKDLPKPKQIAPENPEPSSDFFASKGNSLVFSCLGDNLEPTLKVILSQQDCNHVIFYDENSPLIKYLAERIQSRFSHKHISLVASDHLGKNIVSYIKKMSEKYQCYCNITPGTKQQTVALSQAARLGGFQDRVYSINKDAILTILGEDKLCDCKSPSVSDLVYCQMAPGKQQKPPIDNEDLWSCILQGLAEQAACFNSLRGKYLFSLMTPDDKPIVEDIGGNEIHCYLNQKKYSMDKNFIENRGIWWEAVVTYAFKNYVDPETLWQIEWGWHSLQGGLRYLQEHFTELDVVASFNQHTRIVISCKARHPKKFSLTEEAYIVDSEAKQRFGRFAMSFMAVPYETEQNQIGQTGILTPSLLSSKEKLNDFLTQFLESKRTIKPR